MTNDKRERALNDAFLMVNYSEITANINVAKCFIAEVERADKFERMANEAADNALVHADKYATRTDELIAERAKSAALLEALEFYTRWTDVKIIDGYSGNILHITYDLGMRARVAIKKYRSEG
jgi:hypothetical protein